LCDAIGILLPCSSRGHEEFWGTSPSPLDFASSFSPLSGSANLTFLRTSTCQRSFGLASSTNTLPFLNWEERAQVPSPNWTQEARLPGRSCPPSSPMQSGSLLLFLFSGRKKSPGVPSPFLLWPRSLCPFPHTRGGSFFFKRSPCSPPFFSSKLNESFFPLFQARKQRLTPLFFLLSRPFGVEETVGPSVWSSFRSPFFSFFFGIERAAKLSSCLFPSPPANRGYYSPFLPL